MNWNAFFRGCRSVFDIRGNVWRLDTRSGAERDAAAIAGDWRRLGDGLREVMAKEVVGEHR